MFKEYLSLVARFKAGDKNELTRAAFTHSKLVSYYWHISSFLMLDEEQIKEVKDNYTNALDKYVTEHKHHPLKTVKSGILQEDGFHWNSDTPRCFLRSYHTDELTMRSDIARVSPQNKNLIAETIEHIARLEKFIELEENLDEEQEYKDDIIIAARKDRYRTQDRNIGVTTAYLVDDIHNDETTMSLIKQTSRYGSTHYRRTFAVNADWYENVYKKGIRHVTLGNGKVADVLRATEVETNDDFTLYKAEINYIQGTMEDREALDYWILRNKTEQEKFDLHNKLIQNKTVFIAVSNLDGDTTHAVGNDERWAKSTFTRRSKAAMMKKLGV